MGVSAEEALVCPRVRVYALLRRIDLSHGCGLYHIILFVPKESLALFHHALSLIYLLVCLPNFAFFF